VWAEPALWRVVRELNSTPRPAQRQGRYPNLQVRQSFQFRIQSSGITEGELFPAFQIDGLSSDDDYKPRRRNVHQRAAACSNVQRSTSECRHAPASWGSTLPPGVPRHMQAACWRKWGPSGFRTAERKSARSGAKADRLSVPGASGCRGRCHWRPGPVAAGLSPGIIRRLA
jgi:hypothetical protein